MQTLTNSRAVSDLFLPPPSGVGQVLGANPHHTDAADGTLEKAFLL